jgi:hypothetical protein
VVMLPLVTMIAVWCGQVLIMRTILNIAVEGSVLVDRILEVSESDVCSEIGITKTKSLLWFIFSSPKTLLVY